MRTLEAINLEAVNVVIKETEHNIIIASFDGELNSSNAHEIFGKNTDTLFARHIWNNPNMNILIFDLESLTYINSAGAGRIINTSAGYIKKGIKIGILIKKGEQVDGILEIVGFFNLPGVNFNFNNLDELIKDLTQ